MTVSVLYDVPGPKARRRSVMTSIVGTIAIVAGLAWLIATLAGERTTVAGATLPGLFDPSRWDIFNDIVVWRSLGEGALNTLAMAGAAAALALVVGVLFSFGRTAASPGIRVPVAVLLEFFRGMPVLLMMLFALLVFSTGTYWAGVTALALYNGAIIGEALRAGISALPSGQREAGLSLGLTPVATRFLIEFPQAFRTMLPIIVAQLVVLLKDTSLAYIVGYSELLRTGQNLTQFFGNRYAFSFFFIVLAMYLAMNLLLSWVARIISHRTSSRGGALVAADASAEQLSAGVGGVDAGEASGR